MRVQNVSGESSSFDPSGQRAPRLFYGQEAPSTGPYFIDAPIGSHYWYVTDSACVEYFKASHTPAAADWKPILAGGTTTVGNVVITGDLNVTGTITGGAITAAA